jgi:hypothetical protein
VIRAALLIAGAFALAATTTGCASDPTSAGPDGRSSSAAATTDPVRLTVPSSDTALDSSPVPTTAPTTTTSTTSEVQFPSGEWDVVIQLGDYDFGHNIDQFVWEPELVVYGSGAMYAAVPDGIVDGAMQWRYVRGELPQSQLRALVSAADRFPSESPVGNVLGEDASPQLLLVNDRRWDINDLRIEPYRSFIDDLRHLAAEEGTAEWEPTAWIERPPGSDTCEVVPLTTIESYYSAPVYPHVIVSYPLGPLAC